MDKVYNQEIFTSLMKEFLLLQFVVVLITFFIYKFYIDNLKKGKVIFLVNVVIYSILNFYLIYQIFIEPDLRVGGISFAFEMGVYFLALLFIIVLLLEYLLLKFVVFKFLFKKS